MELATKLLLIIFLGTLLQNEIEATNQMDSLYHDMYMELSRQTDLVFYARAVQREGEPTLPVLTKLEMGRHIYAKIDLLEGILAELETKIDEMRAEMKYFLNEDTVKMFLNFLKKRGQKAELFSDFPSEKIENKSYYAFVRSNEWLMYELLRGKYPVEFFEILDRIMAMELAPEEVDPESGMSATYSSFQFKLIKFIEKLKLEIVVGQTHNDFRGLIGGMEVDKAQIRNKIDEGPKGFSKVLHLQQAIKSHPQKALFKKYKQLNEASLELYNVLAPQIPIIIRKKANKEEVKLSEEAMRLASEVKKALALVLHETLESTSTSKSAHSMLGSKMLEIESQLCLPTQWVENQKSLYGGTDSEAWLLSSIHMNAAMLLLAYERTKKFYD